MLECFFFRLVFSAEMLEREKLHGTFHSPVLYLCSYTEKPFSAAPLCFTTRPEEGLRPLTVCLGTSFTSGNQEFKLHIVAHFTFKASQMCYSIHRVQVHAGANCAWISTLDMLYYHSGQLINV